MTTARRLPCAARRPLPRHFHGREIFFFIALFFSFFRSSMIRLPFTKLGHCYSRQIRFRHVLSGGHDNTHFEEAVARRPHHSNPRDGSAPFEAGWHQSKPADSTGSAGATSTATPAHLRAEKRCAAPARQRTPPTRLCFSFSFSLLSFLFSASALTSHSAILFLRF
jgi:hypothetical protein